MTWFLPTELNRGYQQNCVYCGVKRDKCEWFAPIRRCAPRVCLLSLGWQNTTLIEEEIKRRDLSRFSKLISSLLRLSHIVDQFCHPNDSRFYWISRSKMKRQQLQEQQKQQQQQQQAIMQEQQQQYIQERTERQITRQQITSQQRGQLRWCLKNQEIILLSNSLSNMKNLSKKNNIEKLSW